MYIKARLSSSRLKNLATMQGFILIAVPVKRSAFRMKRMIHKLRIVIQILAYSMRNETQQASLVQN